jgi:hypothetical protein
MFREAAKYCLNPLMAANNAVLDGIDTVRRHLRINENTGQSQLYVDRKGAPNLARYIQSYRWKRAAQRGVNPQDAKPEPLKKDDHAPDALRYLLHSDYVKSLTGAGGRRVEHKYRESLRHKRVPIGQRSRMLVG